MVVSKDDKRKRKESPNVDSSPDVPKRTKVQAQRKFAQGQGNTSASYSLSSTIAASSSQTNTTVRDNKEPIPELISHKKPIAEDLVTYICFRGTPCLPSHLDFFNQNAKSNEKMGKTERNERETTSLNHESKKIKSATEGNKKCEKKRNKTEQIDNCGDDVDLFDKGNMNSEKTGTIGYAARKKADQSVEGNRKFKNNDRLVTLRERALKKFETNRRSPRTRSALKPENEIGEDNYAIGEIALTKKTQVKVPKKATPSVQKKRTARTSSAQLSEKEYDCARVSNLRSKGNVTNVAAPSNIHLPKTTKQTAVSSVENQVPPIQEQQPTNLHEKIVTSVPEKRSNAFNRVPPTSGKQLVATPQIGLTLMTEKYTAEKIENDEKMEDSAGKTSDLTSKISYSCHKKAPVKRIMKERSKAYQENREKVFEITPPKPKRGRKTVETLTPKKPKGNTTQAENKAPGIENKTSRPMRKTKEAATIYMEWIGLKLNLDDDGSSLDSFPELPNAKETQKIENELKKYSLKQRKPTTQTPTKKSKKREIETSAVCKSVHVSKEVDRDIPRFENINKRKSFSDSDDEPLLPQKVEIDLMSLTKFRRGAKKKKFSKLPHKKKPLAITEIQKSKYQKNIVSQKLQIGIEIKTANEIREQKKYDNIVVSGSKYAKSYSDSDDEPLATKLVAKLPEKELKADPEPLQIITKITPVTLPSNDNKICPTDNILPLKNILQVEEKQFPKCSSSPKCLVKPSAQGLSSAVPVVPSIVLPALPRPDQLIKSIIPLPAIAPPGPFTPLERFPSPKVNPSFLTPKFDRNLERKLPAESVASTLLRSNLPSPSVSKLDFPSSKSASPSSSCVVNAKKYETNPNLSANLMPSKEESGKIFGIASVSLAQSSGPDNTKCTLGKCGSIHKPVLGPVVPTEAYLGEPLSNRERRKAKVNMTHEQIQKWLIECSSNPDEIHDDLDDDFEEPLKPKTFAPTPPLLREEKDPSTLSKIGKELRTESTWSGKGPSLKATPVMMKDEFREKSMTTVPAGVAKRKSSSGSQCSLKPIKVFENSAEGKLSPRMTVKRSESVLKLSREATKSPKPSTSSAASSPKRLKNTKAIPDTNQKLLPVLKRQPVYCTKPETMDANKKKPSNNSFSAFSPENETSVYSFDKEDDVPPPVAKPFRRHSRRESNADENISSEKLSKVEKIPAKETQHSSVSLMLSPDEGTKSIKVSLENTEAIAIAKIDKPQADASVVGDSDSEGHTFYIPLQGTSAAATHSGKADVIQGVAVKLGREGPEGPNQRVIMHATLVTKAQMGSNTTPIPESMNVHEIVKSLLSTNKEMSTPGGSKNVPVGTVQPRFKANLEGPITIGSSLTRVNSNSSLLSVSTKSKITPVTIQKKPRDATPIKMLNNTAFPRRDDPTQMVEAPIFRPTDKEFQDPIEFIDRITPIAARFGICKIIPPDSFKPECRVSDDMRFTAYNQYVHKMLHRWGPSAKEFSAIKKYLATQSIAMTHPPWIGGMEVDLPRLYHTVQELGGLKEVIEKKKWARVAEDMCIPKLAQDRVTKLDDIYCKYLLPYDTLSPVERQKLFDEVEADWAKREARARRNADRCANLESISNMDGDSSENDETDEEIDGVSMECIVKGRSMPLNAFFRIARNTMALWFKNTEPTVAEIEAEFWRHVAVRDSHVCVHSGSIDSSGWGYGFPSPGPKTKGSQCAKHPWNLKVLTNNAGSVLRSLGPVMGVTVPTLHVGMLFSACCWYRDPHGLSWIEYLHTGASKIWYGIPDEQSSKFRKALTALIPTHCQNKTIWLPCDTVMVPPHMLTDRGVSLCRVDQKPGEFVVIFPRAYTSSIATGYVVSESVYFATSSWLDSAKDDFKDIHESCEPAMFSLEQLLFAVANDQRVSMKILSQVVPMLGEVFKKELAARNQLEAAGLTDKEKFQPPPVKSKHKLQLPEEHECDFCRANLYISMIRTTEGNIYCLQHALRYINNGVIQAKQCTLIFTYDIEDIQTLITKINDKLSQLQRKGAGSIAISKKSK